MDIAEVNCAAVIRRASSEVRIGGLLILLACGPLAAQTPPDSIALRLRRAEEAIAALQQQLADASQSGVQARSHARLELYGRVLVNAFGNSRRVNNVDNPQFVQPDPAPGTPTRGIGMAIRETSLGLAVTVPDALGGSFAGDLDVDFYGGQTPSSGGRTFPLLRLRTARGFVRWKHSELMIGQESPLISRLNPMTAAAFGTPAFAAAGNLWLWLPQARVRAHTSGRIRIGAEGAVLAPTSGDPMAAFDTDYDVAERSQRPFLEGRAFAAWGEDERRSEIGCGVHQGWLRPAATREDSRAIACDAQLALNEWLDVRGEWFAGHGVRGLGGGGIAQNLDTALRPLSTRGGWAQINARPGSFLRLGAGCGGDHPDPLATRRRNDSCAGYVTVRPQGPIFIGAELRRIRTEYLLGRFTNDHVTLAFGYEF